MLATDPAARPLDPLAFQRHIQDLIAQVDRRDQVATKFGVAPAQPVAKDRTARPLPTFFKPLAWAALLLTIATIAGLALAATMRSRSDVATNEKPIGVPIGVPEASVAPATTPAAIAAAPSIAPTAAPATEAIDDNDNTAGAVAANPPVLTSDPDPTAPIDTAAPATAPPPTADAQPSNQVASNTNARASEPSRMIASNDRAATAEEPMPPGAGPDESRPDGLPAEISETANSYAVARRDNDTAEQPKVTETERSPAPTPAPAARETAREKTASTTVASAATPRPKKSTPVVAAPKRATRPAPEVAETANAMPPVPRGAVRAEYLGTTPDGNLIFGLPSSERGYVAPGESRRRRSRRAAPANVDVLPAEPAVLPALPADDE
jgi:hypothetical protein